MGGECVCVRGGGVRGGGVTQMCTQMDPVVTLVDVPSHTPLFTPLPLPSFQIAIVLNVNIEALDFTSFSHSDIRKSVTILFVLSPSRTDMCSQIPSIQFQQREIYQK